MCSFLVESTDIRNEYLYSLHIRWQIWEVHGPALKLTYYYLKCSHQCTYMPENKTHIGMFEQVHVVLELPTCNYYRHGCEVCLIVRLIMC